MNRAKTHPLYSAVHYWLRKTFGRAGYCEHCNEPRKRFHWALRRGIDYEFKRENFLQLCVSCHMKYDQTDERRRANGDAQRRKDHSYCWKEVEKIHPTTGDVLSRYQSVNKAAVAEGVSRSGISLVLTGRIETIKNFKWRYARRITKL